MIGRRWPQWWNWDLELSLRLFKRMVDRSFSELDLRTILEHARGYRPDIIEGRWVIATTFRRRTWEVVVEPEVDTSVWSWSLPIGIEILAPEKLTLAAINRVLRDLGLPTVKRADRAPLMAAQEAGILAENLNTGRIA